MRDGWANAAKALLRTSNAAVDILVLNIRCDKITLDEHPKQNPKQNGDGKATVMDYQ
jgi:hypothetical protein